jgi:filamentous hemagglutinin
MKEEIRAGQLSPDSLIAYDNMDAFMRQEARRAVLTFYGSVLGLKGAQTAGAVGKETIGAICDARSWFNPFDIKDIGAGIVKGGKSLWRITGDAASWAKNRVFGRGTRSVFSVTDKQLGKKLGRHVVDFGGDPSNADDRAAVISRINDIGANPDIDILGEFRGLGPDGSIGPARFKIQGSDVVVTRPDGEFVTILKNGAEDNSFVKEAIRKATTEENPSL